MILTASIQRTSCIKACLFKDELEINLYEIAIFEEKKMQGECGL